jgi:uracil-DNA glycosylase
MNIEWQLRDTWRTALALEFEKPYFSKLQKFVETQYQTNACAPLPSHIFRIFDLVRLEDVSVVIL